ncbi:alpha/beta hydrolase fold protein [Planococcus antarcticus DSM 14505]|uniref:Alpha/beta hydrolase fold protein n=1 Tax=Planococcus antarcticus DSM 14505 TaxID=1185653 RepID=A0AA87IKD1_9BACL|nr:alpha/beta fold hydrolase [Planococcus antarcticus]EIM06346.1 alpha/beta hydrolase fold protein [Planococcus antarcticus DSM 14505]
MPVFIRNGIELFYEDIGEGRPLLLLHGLTSNSAMFYHEIEFFKNERRVIAMDSRGHGNSSRLNQYTLQDHIDDAIALLSYLELDTIDVLGVSMGSYIAQGVAVQNSEKVKKLILVATKSYGEQSSMAELFDRYPNKFDGLSMLEKFSTSSSYIYHNQNRIDEWLSKTAQNSRQLNMKEQAIAADALKEFDFRQQHLQIAAETLVISGKFDGLNPPEKGRETAVSIPDATFMEFKRSGHAPNVEQPDLFLGIVENFLE